MASPDPASAPVGHRGGDAGPTDDDSVELEPAVAELISAARAVRRHAYAPYSSYRVGAAVRGASGAVHVGCNVENAAYPAGLCAERAAIAAAVAAGEDHVTALALVVGGPRPASPCGICRQVLAELGPDAVVHLATAAGAEVVTTTARDLLPGAFDRSALDAPAG